MPVIVTYIFALVLLIYGHPPGKVPQVQNGTCKMLQKFSGESKRILQEDINLFGRVLSHTCYTDTLALQLRLITVEFMTWARRDYWLLWSMVLSFTWVYRMAF